MNATILAAVLREYLTKRIGALPRDFGIIISRADERWFVEMMCGGRSVWAMQTRDHAVLLDVLDEEWVFVEDRIRKGRVAA